jgi:hypothetical protein
MCCPLSSSVCFYQSRCIPPYIYMGDCYTCAMLFDSVHPRMFVRLLFPQPCCFSCSLFGFRFQMINETLYFFLHLIRMILANGKKILKVLSRVLYKSYKSCKVVQDFHQLLLSLKMDVSAVAAPIFCRFTSRLVTMSMSKVACKSRP